MKFAVAVAFLVQANSAIGEKDVLHNGHSQSAKRRSLLSDKPLRRARSKALKRRMEDSIAWSSSECDPETIGSSTQENACPPDENCVADAGSSLGGFCARLSPGFLVTDNGIRQCDPSSTDPDVGLLSCGDNMLCLTAESSNLGGFCIGGSTPGLGSDIESQYDEERNRGFIYCDISSPYYGFLDCDCSAFDNESMTGSFSCSYSYCFGMLSECCDETCADITVTYARGSENTYTYENCYSFRSPYDQTFCYGQNVNTIDKSASTCFGAFNGIACDSCEVGEDDMSSFICESTGLSNEFQLDSFYPPILTKCYMECSRCALCPENENSKVANPDSFLTFTDFTCGYINYLGELGVWGSPNNPDCMNVRTAANEQCCDLTSQSPVENETSSPETSAPSSENNETEPPSENESFPEDDIDLEDEQTQTPSEPVIPDETNPPDENSDAADTSEPIENEIAATEAPTASSVESDLTNAPTSLELDRDPGIFEPIETDSSCSIRIQTNKCRGLLLAHAGTIPCSCENKCITFINDQFDKCDAGTSIAGSGTIVAGCTLEMLGRDYVCNQLDDQETRDTSDSTQTIWNKVTHSVAVLAVVAVIALF